MQAKGSRFAHNNLCTCLNKRRNFGTKNIITTEFEQLLSLRRELTLEKIKLRKDQENEERVSCKFNHSSDHAKSFRAEKQQGLLRLALTRLCPLSQCHKPLIKNPWKVVPLLRQELHGDYWWNATRSQRMETPGKNSYVDIEYQPKQIDHVKCTNGRANMLE